MRNKRKLGNVAPSKDASATVCLPELVHLAVSREEDEDYDWDDCADGEDPKRGIKHKYKYPPVVVQDVSRSKMGTIIGRYRLESTHKVEVVLVDVDKKGNKIRR